MAHSTFMLSEYLERQNYVPPKLNRKAVVHGHCQHKAVMHMDAEIAVLKKMGLEMDVLDAGCCGVAGAYGFSKDKYDISVRAGERILLPKVREADDETLIIMDGFSCKEQTQSATDRQGMHLAEVIQMALREGDGGAPGPFPERHHYSEEVKTGPSPVLVAALGVGALALVGAALVYGSRKADEQSRRER